MAGRFSVRKMKKRIRKLPGHSAIRVKPLRKVSRARKAAKKAKRKANPTYTVYDSASKPITKTKSKSVAQMMARVIGGHVGARGTIVYSARGKRAKNPCSKLPVGKMITVKARKNRNGSIDLYR